MTGERSYTTKIWRQPSSIWFSRAAVLSTSVDPAGEPVISTRKRPCQKIQNGSEFPELVARNSRNPPPSPPDLCFQWVGLLPKTLHKNSSNSVLRKSDTLMAGKYAIYKYVK